MGSAGLVCRSWCWSEFGDPLCPSATPACDFGLARVDSAQQFALHSEEG